jgi:hypothetical protein
VDPRSVQRAGDRLATETTRLRAALVEVARTTADVMILHAAGLDRVAASYRRLAQTDAPPGSAYYLQRAVQLEGQAARVRVFAEHEAHESLSLTKPRRTPTA